MKKLFALILALVMALSLVACGGGKTDEPAKEEKPAASETTDGKTEAEPETIKIGMLFPMSGNYGTSGLSLKYAAEVAADVINNELGGIQNLGGAKLELIFGDTLGDSAVALAEYERMQELGCKFYIGAYNSGVTQAMLPTMMANDTLMITSNAFSDTVYTTPNENLYHVFDCSSLAADRKVELELWKKENLKDYTGEVVGYIYAANDYGRDAYNNYVATAEAAGIKEVVGVPVEAGAADFSAAIMALKGREDISFLTCSLPAADSVLVMRQLRQYGIGIPLFAEGSGFVWADILEQLGEGAEYIYSAASYLPEWWRSSWDPDLALEYTEKCYEDLGWGPDENFSVMWGDVWTLWDVLERTASLESNDLRKALRETNITGDHMALLMTAYESISFPESVTAEGTGVTLYNQNPGARQLWAQVQDGQYRIVWPPEFADPDYPYVYPIPQG